MSNDESSAYDIGALKRDACRRKAERVARQLAPIPREGGAYDLNYVALVTHVSKDQQRIVRCLTGVQ